MEKLVYILEAKTAPNQWQKISSIYPDIDIVCQHPTKEDAFEAKSRLKSLLAGRYQGVYKKRPIRIKDYPA